MADVAYARTADGDLAAKVAHLVIALVPQKDGTMRTLTAWPARDPSECTRRDFNPSGFAANDEASFRREVSEFAEHEEQKIALNRRAIPNAQLRMMHTPWGTPDTGHTYAEGIVSVGCPGHGGFILSEQMNGAVHPAWAAEVRGGEAYYEEDAEWAIVAHTFPELFTERERKLARRTLINGRPDEWEIVTGTTILPGQSHERDRSRWMADNKGKWMTRAGISSKIHPGKVLVTATIDMAPATPYPHVGTRFFLVDADRYNQRTNPAGTYLIDETVDIEVNYREEPISAAS